MITINFIEVGRNNLSWSDQFKTLTHSLIVKFIKKRGALMSQDIELDFETGTVYVGGFRSVGFRNRICFGF
jgi:hypothetical protein